MPYLNWETYRYGNTVSQLLDQDFKHHQKARDSDEAFLRQQEQLDRGELYIPSCDGKRIRDLPLIGPVQSHNLGDRFVSIVYAALEGTPLGRDLIESSSYPFKSDKDGRIIAGTHVGQVLFDAAILYEQMLLYRDCKLALKYLHSEPPLHLRRWLEEACPWSSKPRHARPTQQTLYLGTAPSQANRHRISPRTRRWNCHDLIGADRIHKGSPSSSTHPTVWRTCRHCREQVRKTARALVVDELWMWILDNNTVLTCFPNRYGMREYDGLGVHASIRRRLKSLSTGRINSVFDLGQVILEETSQALLGQISQVR